ncbi:MAG: hypothetical protein B6I18_01880 [Bacteroidetes bacterium 4572_112]|nr:MAG: hypothetical protein B6I18_01880 [Bacteroidetes bacterium 4572_112]
MKNKLILVIVLLTMFGLNNIMAQSNTLFYNLNGFKGDKVVLFSTFGDQVKPIDTAYRQSTGAYVFFNINLLATGVYTVYFNDSLYTELIINKEDIVIRADAKNLMASIQVLKSQENKILFDYWNYAIEVKDSTMIYEYKIRKIELKTYDTDDARIVKMKARIKAMEDGIDKYVAYQAKKYPNSFAPKLLKAYMIPEIDSYNQKHPNKKYSSEQAFLKDHFFDNIDFNDERFLQTKVIYTVINDYIKTFGQPAATVNYNAVIDKVLSTAVVNNKVYEYCLDLFFRTFETSIYENVMVHLIDDYYLPYYSLSGVNTTYYSHLSERIKALKPGKKSPNIILKDTSGVLHNLYETDAKAKMIVFYSSDCPHCEDALPGLLEIFTMYQEQGLIAYGIAIDDDKELWKREIRKFSMNWTSVSDLKGLLSPYMDEFNIRTTPYIMILNKDNIIMKKPSDTNEIHSTLVQLLNEI